MSKNESLGSFKKKCPRIRSDMKGIWIKVTRATGSGLICGAFYEKIWWRSTVYLNCTGKLIKHKIDDSLINIGTDSVG